MADKKNKKNKNTELELPMIALKGVVVFPNTMVSIDVGRKVSVEAVEYALKNGSKIFIVSQINLMMDDGLTADDVYQIGTISEILQVVRLPGNVLRIIVEGKTKATVQSFIQGEAFFKVSLKESEGVNQAIDLETESLIRVAQESFEEFARISVKLTPDSIFSVISAETPKDVSYLISSSLSVSYTEKQRLLAMDDDIERLQETVKLLLKEIDLLNIQKTILEKVKDNIDKNQKDYYLKEQLKVIQEELGDLDGIKNDIVEYRAKIEKANFPTIVLEKLEKELKRLARMSPNAAEVGVTRDYIECLLELPFEKKDKESKDLKKAEEILNQDHYGLEKIKERIIEFLAVRQTAEKSSSPVLCLVGPPGVGKTSIAKSIAKSLGRKYIRMSLGGVRDEAEIRGHRRTYVGSMPGRIISSIRRAGTSNPLILLDEVDKIGKDLRGDPASALLEVLDAEQNFNFRDHYLEVPFDISDVIFICTANSLETIPYALKDRLEIIPLSSYTEVEKNHIAKNYLFKKQLSKHGLKKNQLKIYENIFLDIISSYTKEAGVRELERNIGVLCRKAVKNIVTENKKTITITKENVSDYLGTPKYKYDTVNELAEVGVAKGLAWTSVGGDTLSIEVNVMKGTGKFELTGNLGNVMKESAHAAISYTRSKYEQLNINKNFYKETDIHIHIPEGAVPKDGPSAGITMATAIISALTNSKIDNLVGMTGEITIRGRVLPIGGLKEKVLAAKKAGLKKIIIPYENEKDLADIDSSVKQGLDFITVKDMDEVLKNAFVD